MRRTEVEITGFNISSLGLFFNSALCGKILVPRVYQDPSYDPSLPAITPIIPDLRAESPPFGSISVDSYSLLEYLILILQSGHSVRHPAQNATTPSDLL